MPTPTLLQRLKERKLVQWALAYLAGAWVLFEVSDAVGGRLGWPDGLYHGLLVLLGVGFFVALVLAWYHGEKGRQRVSGPELLMVAALLVVAGVAVSTLGPDGETDSVSLTREADNRPGIVVLPCTNMSPDPDDAYLASGLHEEILVRLQKIASLFSIGRTSVQQYAEDPPPTDVIAASLGVGFVGECSVRKSLDQIRLTFQLLDGPTGGQLWSENYDTEFTPESLFAVQSDIAQQVALAVGAVLTGEERARIEAIPTTSLGAYELYLLGRHRWTIRSPETIREAIQYFEAAISLDSTFPLAFTGLADAYLVLPWYDMGTEPMEVYDLAKAAATRAYELDPSAGEVHASLGSISLFFELDWMGAEQHLAAAVELAPGYPSAHHWYSNFLASVGRFDESVAEVRTALTMDPRSNVLVWAYADRLWRAGRIEEARMQFEQAVASVPPLPWAFQGFARSLTLDEPRDRVRAGELLAEFAVQFDYPTPDRMAAVAEALSGSVEAHAEALVVLDDLVERTQLDRADLLFLYGFSAPLDVFFDVLDEAVEAKHFWVAFAPSWYPVYVPELNDDPRWEEFLIRIRYPGILG
jgi:TolB-like protein